MKRIIYNLGIMLTCMLSITACQKDTIVKGPDGNRLPTIFDTDDNQLPTIFDMNNGLYVNFVYDYNIQRADMFKDHVGYVTVYVFDESDNLVAKRSVGNYGEDNSPLKTYGYRMHFTGNELPAGTYHLTALAMQKDWDNALATPGPKYRRTEPSTPPNRTNKQELCVTLDRNTKNAEGICPVSGISPLDTLWHGTMLGASTVTVDYQKPSYATIALVRDTKVLDLTIRDIDTPSYSSHDRYAITIIAKNGRLDFDNNLLPDDSLQYIPYAAWTTQFPEDEEGDAVYERTAHYNINFNRIMYRSSTENDAVLKIVNLSNGKVIGEFDLAYILSEGHSAYETQNYSRQEYLDREYDYHLDFFLKGDKWSCVAIQVGILAWTKRIWNTE